MKQLLKSYATLIGLFTILTGCILTSTQANAKTYKLQDNYYGGSCSVVINKGKVYYSIAETGSIYCYNIKTKKNKTIVKKKGNGFSNLKLKGNYLYAVYDSYMGSDGSNYSIVRVSIKNGKTTKLAKGCNYVLDGKKIYYTKTKRIKTSYGGYDKELGIYSMTLTGKKSKAAKGVIIDTQRDEQETITTSKGSLSTTGYTKKGYYFSKTLHFTSKDGKSTVIYDINADKKAPSYSTLHYYTLQGDYIVYKKVVLGKNDIPKGQLVLVKKNGKGARVFYSKPSVSNW